MIILGPLIQVVNYALGLYIWVVIISVALSWLVQFNVLNTHSQFVYMLGNALYRLTEPALRPIRRVVPNFGGIDITPVVLILVIWFVRLVLDRILFSLDGAVYG